MMSVVFRGYVNGMVWKVNEAGKHGTGFGDKIRLLCKIGQLGGSWSPVVMLLVLSEIFHVPTPLKEKYG